MGTEAIGPTNDGPQRRTMMRLILNRSRSLGRAALIAGMAALPMSLPAMAQQHGGTLIAAFSADPAGFDPVRGPSGMSHVVIEQVYSTLMLLDPDANPIPGLAKSYEMSPDGKEYTFKLRDGVTFHNGDPLTAEDVKFSFDRLRAPELRLLLRLAGRDHRRGRSGRPPDREVQAPPGHRSLPDLHGVPRLFDRAQEAGRIGA